MNLLACANAVRLEGWISWHQPPILTPTLQALDRAISLYYGNDNVTVVRRQMLIDSQQVAGVDFRPRHALARHAHQVSGIRVAKQQLIEVEQRLDVVALRSSTDL
jgi:hypothetical protein